jgi:preprotein translocase subunit SecE
MLVTLYLIEQSFDLKEAVRYSIGLVVVCLVMLILLWLPDILKEK